MAVTLSPRTGQASFFYIEGEKPFLKAKDVPELREKAVPLQSPSEVQGVSIPALPGMKDHSPLPGAQWDPKIIDMVRRSNELSVQTINAMKTK